jgi:hypothetical protein
MWAGTMRTGPMLTIVCRKPTHSKIARLTPDTSHLQHLRIAFSNILKQLKTGDSRHGKIQD